MVKLGPILRQVELHLDRTLLHHVKLRLVILSIMVPWWQNVLLHVVHARVELFLTRIGVNRLSFLLELDFFH